ncbi:MAG: hypothetical protein AAGH46_06125 [Bacteroidota bacterium]
MIISIFLYQKCNETNLEQKPPFQIEEAFFTFIPSGIREGISVYNIEIQLKPISEQKKKPLGIKGIYFMGSLVELQEVAPNNFKGGLSMKNPVTDGEIDSQEDASISKPDIPDIFKKWDKSLQANESILYFLDNEKTKYHKLTLERRMSSSIPR